MANPWEQNAEPINNPAATSMQGAPAPSGVSANDTSVPWHESHAPINNPAGNGQGGSVWETIKSNMGARVDALAAGMLQDEGSDRSRYAMKRAERSNQEARVQESQLSGMQKVGVGAADIGTGLAMAAVPGVGPELTAAYFGAQGTADQLREQAETDGRYDVQKAAQVGIAQGAAGVGAGHAAGALVGKLLPTVADKFVGQALTSATGGAGGGASMQMISNIANGKSATEGVGDATLYGAVGGLGAHAAAPAVRAVARAPKTLRDIQDAGAAEFARKNPGINTGEEAPVEQPQAAPAVSAEEGALGGAAQQPGGAIPTPESQWIPGSENLNPEQYGEYKGPTRMQGGLGFGEGAPAPRNPDSILGEVQAAPTRGIHIVKDMWNNLREGGLTGMVSPKGLKQMSDAELTTEKLGLKSNPALTKVAKETEGTVDLYQQALESHPVGSPEYQAMVNNLSNLTLEGGSAAAHTRANALALDTGMPMTAKFHDVTLHEGLNNEKTPTNIARDVHGMSPNDINAEHKAVLESRGSSILGSRAEEQADKYQTFESHYNATNKAYKLAKQKVDDAFNDNYELALRTREQLSRSEQPELYQRALDLTNAMDDLRQLKTSVSNGDPLNVNKLATVQRQIIDHGTALGLTPKFKNVLGEAGTFNPALDLEAWHNFNTRTRLMHKTAPKGSFKDAVASGDVGIDGVDFNKPATWVKPITKVATSAAKRYESVSTQAKGYAMAKEAANRPERASEEHIEEQLKSGNTTLATEASESALNKSGINTDGPVLADTPAQEVQAAQTPAVDPAVQAHIDTLLRGSKGIVDARNAEGVAGRAGRPAPIEEAPVAAPEEAAPVQEGPGAFAQGNQTPTQLPEPAPAQESAPEVAPVQPEETAPQQVEPEAPQGPGKFAEGNTRPNAPVPAEIPPEAIHEPTEGIKAPRKLSTKEEVKPETEEAPKEQTQEETPTTDKPVKPEETDFKTDNEGKVSETAEQRNKRVADMAKKMITEKTEEVLKTPIKKLSKDHSEALKMKAEAEGMKKGIKDVLDFAKDIADKEGTHHADVMTAVMTREGGIESLFRDGFGKDAIKGRMNTAVKAYKTERRQMARQAVESANEIVRTRLGEAKVGATREEMNDRIRSNLKSMGLEDKVIQGAFSKAAEAGNGNYTARHVVNYARQIMKDIRAEAKGTKPAERINHVANSREQLHKHIDSLGVDSFTRSALRKVVANHTQVGATGQRGALTETETKAVMADISKALATRAAEAKAALSKKPAGSPAAKAQQEKVSKIEEAQEQAEQTKGSVEADLANVRESEAKAKEASKASEKRAQEAESKLADVSSKMENFVKDFEANKAKAVAEAKAELRKEATGMTTDQVEQFGKQVGEELPDSIGSTSDPEYISWKASNDVAAEELAKRGLKADANFLRHFGDLVEKGLTRLEELPDHRDLVITQTEYNQLRDMYNKVKKGDELDVGEAGNVQMGTMGIKLRTLLLGDANARNKIRYNSDRLNAERRKALAEKEGTGSFGEGSPDIVAKPAKIEAAEATESKPKAALTPKTEAEVAYAKQKTKITRMQKKLNDDRYWAINDNEYGTKWKAHKSAIEAEKYKLNKMPKK